MRLIQNYIFNIGTKIPFSQWPEIVHQFLQENHLISHRFLYYFDDIASDNICKDGAFPRCGCTRILKDCPALGEIRFHNGRVNNRFDILWLSNIDKQENFPEEAVLPLMKKIHRTYGFCSSILSYFDIDFFGKRTHFCTKSKERDSVSDPADVAYGFYGSGITLHRDACTDNYIKLSVDILHDGVVMDATPYCEAMKALLPNIKPSTTLELYLSEEEQQKVDEINRSAEPLLQQCCAFLEEHLKFNFLQNYFSYHYSVAKPLKKLAKQYGFTYRLLWNGGVYSLEKRTARGNVLFIDVDCGPSRLHLGLRISYQGVGFFHSLATTGYAPTCQEETDAYLEHVMSVVSQFESTLLPNLDCLFPETPDWYIPTDFPRD